MKKKKNVGCIHCHKMLSVKESIYMVKDYIWKQTSLPFISKNIFIVLHTTCLESLIGRKLILKDFIVTPKEGYARLKIHYENNPY